MDGCIFCKISSGEIKVDMLYEDDSIVAFRDIDPQAPQHILVIPKEHIPTLDDVSPEDAGLLGHMLLKARDIASKLGMDKGYRIVVNCNSDGGQEVFHIHVHLLGGRQMKWPPG
ncbi:MAG: histidine triad nucleotide-binding protein [Candidatus Omnitrophica bacterium]|nr:histidine triad nucleotide-binding protein [Candidatus Omnitrophota bacterium]MDD5488801.1 histidine triad nucleotide-binding protein [Candidatus Omnitrophota bacterium]